MLKWFQLKLTRMVRNFGYVRTSWQSGTIALALAILGMAVLPGGAIAETRRAERPEAFRKLVDCRSVAEPAARLACYDAQVAALDAAEQKEDLVIVDRQQVDKAKRGLFGFTLPKLKLFGADDKAVTHLESVIKSARPLSQGRWMFVLEDGAVWRQTDNRSLNPDPKAGMPIKIRRAALGSYLANVDGQTAIRVRREN
jgi:hypothetical protein